MEICVFFIPLICEPLLTHIKLTTMKTDRWFSQFSLCVCVVLATAFTFAACTKENSDESRTVPENEVFFVKNYNDSNCELSIVSQRSPLTKGETQTYRIQLHNKEVNHVSLVDYSINSNQTGTIYHYTTDGIPLALLIFEEGKLLDIDILTQTSKTKGLGDWWECTVKHYENMKDMIILDPEADLICDLIDIFGMCVTANAIAASVHCL